MLAYRVLISFCSLLYAMNVNANHPNLQFKHITRDDGLASNNVSAIVQDDLGFMWFGTEEGLSRFDGYSFLNFSHSNQDSLSLINNHIDCIVKDESGNLWIGTRGGLNYMDISTYEIHRLSGEVAEVLDANSVGTLYCTSDKLYIGTNNIGLLILNLKTNQVTHYKNDPRDTTTLSNDEIFNIYEDKNQNVWVGTLSGLELLDQENGQFKHFCKGQKVRCVTEDIDDSLVVSLSGDERWYYKTDRGFEPRISDLPDLSKYSLVFVFFDRHGNRWTVVRDVGVYYDDIKNNTRVCFSFDRNNPEGISSNTIFSMFEDRRGNIWLATSDFGVNLLDVKSKPFIHVRDNHSSTGLNNNNVRAVFQDSDDDIWIGTKKQGMLSRFDRETLTFQHYKHDPLDPESLNDDFVFCIAEESPGLLWVGTMRGGLNLFDKNTGKFKSIQYEPGVENSLKSNYITALFKKSKDELWIGHLSSGIDVYNTRTGQFRNYQSTGDSLSLSSNYASVFHMDQFGDLWIGTWYGLNLYHEETDSFESFEHDPASSQSISSNHILCVYEDKSGRLWVGTKYGLNLLNRTDFTFQRYYISDGLPNDVIAGIAEDRSGNLWLSTNLGLSKFNPNTGSFVNYTKEDGLQGDEFMKYAYCQTENGELMFGGNNGFNIFNPADIDIDRSNPEIRVSNFKLFNKTVSVGKNDSPLEKHISQTDTLILSYFQNSFTFEYVALNFSSSARVKFAYQLEGFDNDWNFVDFKREAIYTNIPPGAYNFKVKATNNDGVWNKESRSVFIKILPPPWLTWWAYKAYVLTFLFLIYWFRKATISRVKKEKEHELHQHKLSFFIDVSHDFRTPISLILNPAKKLLRLTEDVESKNAAVSIYQSAQKITNLVDQLLEFSRLEQGGMVLNKVQSDIVPFTQQVVSLFSELSIDKNITLHFNSEYSSIITVFDPARYEKILNNLLSNAIKFTPNEGEISVSLSLVKVRRRKSNGLLNLSRSQEYEFVELNIEDTGIGIQNDQVDKLFDRFYKESESSMGTGIGLNYVKGLVELHGGYIEVHSELGVGSTFTVRLPSIKSQDIGTTLSNDEFSLDTFNYTDTGRDSLEYDMVAQDISVSDLDDTKEDDYGEVKKIQVLIVEDNKKLRDHISEELRAANYKVIEAFNGRNGWEMANQYFPDLILSDIKMPEMDGIELCVKLKSDEVMRHIPLVLLTSKNLVEDRIQAYKMEIEGYISKPFDMDELKIRIKNILDMHKRLKERYSANSLVFEEVTFSPNNKDEAFLIKVTKIANDNVNDPNFTFKDLIKIAGYSQTAFYRKMSAITGMSPGYFMHTIKIKEATRLLLQGELSVKEIGYKLGYNSPSYFNKYFLKVIGKTPLEFIKNQQDSESSDSTS